MSDYAIDRIKSEIDLALNPKGMSTHSGKVKLDISHVLMLIRKVEHLEKEVQRLKEPR